jgi:ABC-2 type transport system permease protein
VSELAQPAPRDDLLGELRKIPAFLRRDALVAWSYRVQFVSDWGYLVLQAFVFYWIGRLVDPKTLPQYGHHRTTYLEFVAVGISVGVFVQLALVRVAAQLRQEQLAGTLEALLLTPTRPTTIQVGSVTYDLLYVPVRTCIFLALIAVGFGLRFHAGGIAPAALILLLFIPFMWGLGILSGASTLTVRRGANAVGPIVALMAIGSGAYFPLDVMPGWLQAVAHVSPMTLAVRGMRQSLLAGISGGQLLHIVWILAVASACSIAVGAAGFRYALIRESRRGSLGHY